MPSCPACLSTSTNTSAMFTAGAVAQVLTLREQDARRHDEIRSFLARLWGGETCELKRCADCGFGFAWPYAAGDAQLYQLVYPNDAYPTDRWEYGRTLQALNGKRDRVLEIGSGPGVFLDRLRAPDSTALEYSEPMCVLLRSKGYTAIHADVRTVALEPFDAIFMFQVLEHLDGLDQLLDRIAGLAKADVFISVPNDEYTSFIEAHGHLVDVPPIHIGRWTPKAIEKAWGRHGFSVVAMESEPFRLAEFARLDLVYHFFSRSERRGTVANRVRSLPKGMRRQVLGAAVAATYAPMRVPVWMAAKHGATTWAHLRRRLP